MKYKLSCLEKSVMASLVFVRSWSPSQFKWFFEQGTPEKRKEIRTQFVEGWVLFRFLILVYLVFSFSTTLSYFLLVLYLFVDGFNYRLCVIFVDPYKKDWDLRSRNRSLILLIINYIEMIVAFAALYLNTSSVSPSNGQPISAPIDALYFSLVTITTLGYGDVTPCNTTGKVLVFSETLAGLVFIVIVVATFLGWNQVSAGNKTKPKA